MNTEFKILIMRSGHTQTTLAETLKTTQQKVSMWVNGSEPKYSYLPQIAEALGVDIETVVMAFLDKAV